MNLALVVILFRLLTHRISLVDVFLWLFPGHGTGGTGIAAYLEGVTAMERELLEKGAADSAEIAKEIRRVCEETTSYFLTCGTFWGAVSSGVHPLGRRYDGNAAGEL